MSHVRLAELDLAFTRGLHLGSREHDARLDAVEELVVVPRAAVVRDQFRLSHSLSEDEASPASAILDRVGKPPGHLAQHRQR